MKEPNYLVKGKLNSNLKLFASIDTKYIFSRILSRQPQDEDDLKLFAVMTSFLQKFVSLNLNDDLMKRIENILFFKEILRVIETENGNKFVGYVLNNLLLSL